MILKTFLIEKSPVVCSSELLPIFRTGGVAVHREQALSQLRVLPYNVSHALLLYLFSIAVFRFVITIKCPTSYRRYNIFFEREFPLKMTQ